VGASGRGMVVVAGHSTRPLNVRYRREIRGCFWKTLTAAMGRVRESDGLSSRHSIGDLLPIAWAVSEALSWSRASATGNVGSTLRAVVGAQVSLAPERPECAKTVSSRAGCERPKPLHCGRLASRSEGQQRVGFCQSSRLLTCTT